ncbi:MAG: tetratricopeptide repeat protein, partial [Phycisphaerae bacterium]
MSSHGPAQQGAETVVSAGVATIAASGPPVPFVDPDVQQLNAALCPADGSAARYHVVERIGQGGMGAVYRAEQRAVREGELRRADVAIKVIALGMNSREVVARFEAERQALALMNHPNIAAVFDAGLLRDGRPYFVMEYIRGRPITEFADEHRLDVAARLRLFQQVCDAIRHAHQRAVIHRDIKPANVLAYFDGEQARAKVVDFGIAKALGGRLGEQTVDTRANEAMGTYAYMSPEQARGSADVDTRTDVYSLGATLYELLVGVVPLDVGRASQEAVMRMIREQDPPPPGARLSGLGVSAAAVAGRRGGVGIAELVRQFRGELSWVLLKALKKERGERYADPGALSADIDNYLARRPLIAGPDTVRYRVRKFVRRRRAAVAAEACAVLAAGVGAGFYVWSINAERARTASALAEVTRQKAAVEVQRAKAVDERDAAKAVLTFLSDRVLNGATPASIPDRAVRDQIVRAMIDPAVAAVGTDFKDRPLVEAAVRNAISVTLDQLGRSDLALVHYERSYALHKAHLPADHVELLESQSNYAYILWRMHRAAEAEPIFRDVLARRARVLGPEHPDTIMSVNNVAATLESQGRVAEAVPLFKDAADRHARAKGPDDADTLGARANYARVLARVGRAREAADTYEDVVARRTRVSGPDHPDTLAAVRHYASLVGELGRTVEAEAMLVDGLARARRVMGDDSFLVFDFENSLAMSYEGRGEYDRALAVFKEAMERCERARGPDERSSITALSNYAITLKRRRRYAEAEPLLSTAVGRSAKVLGADHADTIAMRGHYAEVLLAMGKRAEAEPQLREAAAAVARTEGPDAPPALTAAARHAALLDSLGRAAEADAIYAAALERSIAADGTKPAS